MQYQVRAQAVEAERVTLAGQEMQAVAMNGRVHLVPAEVFDVFFQRVAVDERQPFPVVTKAPMTKREMKKLFEQEKANSRRPLSELVEATRSTTGGAQARSLEIREIILKALAEVGPLTTAEIGDRTHADTSNGTLRYQGAWSALKKLAEEHLVEKRDDLKWHLVNPK